MNDLDEFRNKKVAVLGMGIEGLALVDFLIDKECQITILDKLSLSEIKNRLEDTEKDKFGEIISDKNINKVLGDNYLDDLKSFDIIFRSPGISITNPKIQEAVKNGVVVSSQIKLFFDLCPCQIIGVTGTKGKGTTSSLIFEILKKNFQFSIFNFHSKPNDQMTNGKINEKWEMKNGKLPQVYLAGNIGYPAITLIPKLKSDDIVILELSSFQLMDLDKSPHIAVVTNLSVDHLDYHKDVNEYRDSKTNILRFQTASDYAVLNSDSTFVAEFLSNVQSKIKYFSHTNDKDATVKNDEVILDPKNRSIAICDKNSIKLFGRHNLENIAAASIAADILEVDPETIKEAVKEFKGLPHRLELVAEIEGVKFINDSFATNPEPTIAALNSFSENKILILGGSSKGANFDELAEHIVSSEVIGVVLIGFEGEKIKHSLLNKGYGGKIISGGNSMDEIVSNARIIAQSGDIVILSPACASFVMFKNYKDRGEKFKTEVLNFINNQGIGKNFKLQITNDK